MKKIFLFFVVLILTSCATELYVPKQASANTSLADLKKGRDLYVKKCSGCHQLYLPKQYDEKNWKINLNMMQAEAEISDEEKQLIYQYITSAPKK
jgi:hypothetical protein